jgi:O-antigen ligase
MSATLQVSDKKMQLLVVVFLVIAVVVGAIMPVYVDLLGDHMARLAALPALLFFAFLVLYDRKLSLMMIIVLRSAGDNLLELTRFSLGGYQIGVGGLINAAVIMIALMLVLENPKSTPKYITASWIVFLTLTFFGLVIAPAKGEALRFWLGLLSYFAIFSSSVHFIKNEKDLRLCIKLILLSSLLPAMYSFVDVALHHGSGGTEGFRLKSTFSHPNVLAFYLVLLITLLFYFIKSMAPSKNDIPRIVLFCYLILLAGLLVLTKTRSAWAVCLLTFVLYGVFFQRRYLGYLLVLGVLALCIPVVRERLMDLGHGNQVVTYGHLNSFAWRLYIWRSALGWMQPPSYIWGNGLQSFKEFSRVFFPGAGQAEWGAHSVYVQIFFEMGAIGVIVFLTLFATIFSELKKIIRFDRLLAFFLLMTVANFMVCCVSDNMLDYLSFNWYFWFVVGVGCAYLKTAEKNAAAGPDETLGQFEDTHILNATPNFAANPARN